MKCEYCGGSLSLEDEYCPHCGQPNKHAKQHIKDMRRFQGEFEDTRNYVYEKTKTYTEMTVRVIIIAVLIILIVVTSIARVRSWKIVDSLREGSAAMHYAGYSKVMDQYLAEEDYVDFYQYCLEKNIRYYKGAYEEQYGRVIQLAMMYSSLLDNFSNYIDFQEGGSPDTTVRNIQDSLYSFYRYYEEDSSWYYGNGQVTEQYLEAADTMLVNVEDILVTYCGFTREEAQEMQELSSASRAVLLEEKLEERLKKNE